MTPRRISALMCAGWLLSSYGDYQRERWGWLAISMLFAALSAVLAVRKTPA